jgi:hypothetical protein
LQQRRGVGCGEILAFSQAQQQRRALAGDHQLSRHALRQHRDGIGALELCNRFPHRSQQVAASSEMLVDQVGDDFGIGVGIEPIAGRDQPFAHRLMVLDDAVMDHCQAVRADVGMSVTLGGRPMGGPARVRDAHAALDTRLFHHLCKRSDPADAAQAAQAAVDDRDPGGVIATVFEFAQALEQNRNDITLCDGGYDSTHFLSPGMKNER